MSAVLPREPGLYKRGLLWLALLAPLFFASYSFANWFTALRNDVGVVVFAWESQIPLLPWTIIPYWSIDLLYGLSFLLPTRRAEMDRHALRLLTAQLLCISCFLLWPLRFSFERPELGGLFGLMFDILMGFDKPFNQAPSLHICLLVVLWACFAGHARGLWRVLLHLWFVLIGLSVLTTWQHHFIDLASGLLAGFFCLWLWPTAGSSPLLCWQLAKVGKRWRLACYYALGALFCAAAARYFAGIYLWLLWPAASLLLVALNYALFGAEGFQKAANGQLSAATNWLLAPYLALAWLNSRLWTRHHPQADEVLDGVCLGRLPGRGEADNFAAIFDLCGELPCHPRPDQHYQNLPCLDLVVPNATLCLQAAITIENLRLHGKVLVCCALGYSRSATVTAAWLLHSGRCQSLEQAIALLRQARMQIVLSEAHLAVLRSLLPSQAVPAGVSQHGH